MEGVSHWISPHLSNRSNTNVNTVTGSTDSCEIHTKQISLTFTTQSHYCMYLHNNGTTVCTCTLYLHNNCKSVFWNSFLWLIATGFYQASKSVYTVHVLNICTAHVENWGPWDAWWSGPWFMVVVAPPLVPPMDATTILWDPKPQWVWLELWFEFRYQLQGNYTIWQYTHEKLVNNKTHWTKVMAMQSSHKYTSTWRLTQPLSLVMRNHIQKRARAVPTD